MFFYNSKADDLKEIKDEIRKLKAIIVKHENRIRALEASNKEMDSKISVLTAPVPEKDILDSTVDESNDTLAPDEV